MEEKREDQRRTKVSKKQDPIKREIRGKEKLNERGPLYRPNVVTEPGSNVVPRSNSNRVLDTFFFFGKIICV